MGLQLEFRHDCQNLGCSAKNCNLCKLCQRRRCPTNFASKYLAPCDVVEAKCGAQIYVVVVDEATGKLMQQGLEELAILISIVDGRKFETEGDGSEEVLERCELLTNKQGQPLLAHGRSGSYTDIKRVLVPMIHGQALLPDLKITDSSEALLTGRAPPFRLSVRAVHRSGEPFHGVRFALSEPFVVATARVKGAAKLEIPHIDDHVSKIDCVGLQTQKKLEDIKAAAAAAGVPDLNLPINCVVKVGQFRDLVETAERNKALRETLKQVLRLTKGWDVARDHVRRAVETDMQLRVYHPDGRTEVGLVFKCGSFNVIDINRPVGLMRRKQNPAQANQELVDVIWLPLDTSCFPDAVKRMLPQASADWRKETHPGWALLPLTTGHMPPYSEGGKPTAQTSSFTFTVRMAGTPPPGAGPTPMDAPSPRAPTPAASAGGLPGMGLPGMSNGGYGGAPSTSAGLGGYPGLPGMAGLGLPPSSQQLPAGFVPGSGGQPDFLFQQQQQQPQQQQQQQQQPRLQQAPPPFNMGGLPGLGGELPPGLAGLGLDANALQGLIGMPTMDLYGSTQQAAAAAAAQHQQQQQQSPQQLRGLGGTLPPELAHLLKEDSLSPFEDPNFQQLMSMVAAGPPPDVSGGGGGGRSAPVSSVNPAPVSGRGPAPRSGGSTRDKQAVKRKADTSLETFINMSKGGTLDMPDMSLPPGISGAPSMPSGVALESLFHSMLPGGEVPGGGGPAPPPVGFFPAMPSSGGGSEDPGGGRAKSPRVEAAAASESVGARGGEPSASGAAPMDTQQASQASGQQQQQQQQADGGAPERDVSSPGAAAAAAQAAALRPAPAPLVRDVTLEDMQREFARAMRQEISFGELESYLRRYNLLPSGAAGGGGQAAAEALKVKPDSGGLEDMQTIEMALPR